MSCTKHVFLENPELCSCSSIAWWVLVQPDLAIYISKVAAGRLGINTLAKLMPAWSL